MGQYTAETIWSRGDQDFLGKRYSRKHLLRFDGGIEVAGSSSPQVVPLPYSEAAAIDPEEAFVSAISSCHMLWFLDIASRNGFCVDCYHDEAVGIMGKDARGKYAITHVTLRPAVTFSGDHIPDRATQEKLHHEAHDECFIANSVKAEILVEPV
jgi:organic hydroperoxide reductase OsmC/OhrA